MYALLPMLGEEATHVVMSGSLEYNTMMAMAARHTGVELELLSEGKCAQLHVEKARG
jgi:hypothetical protein